MSCSAPSTEYFKICLSGQIFYKEPRNFASTFLPKPRQGVFYLVWDWFYFLPKKNFWLFILLSSIKAFSNYSEILPKPLKQQETFLNLLNNGWRKMFSKEEQIMLHVANSGRLVSKLPTVNALPREHTNGSGWYKIFLTTPYCFNISVNSHCTSCKQEGNISKNKRGKEKHFSAYENCQNYLSEVYLARFGF